MSSVPRNGLDRGFDDGGLSLLGNLFGTPASRAIRKQPGQTFAFITLPPRQYRGKRSRQIARKKVVGQPFGRAQNDVHAEKNPSWNIALAAECHQLLPV